jgi:hypothetical protein
VVLDATLHPKGEDIMRKLKIFLIVFATLLVAAFNAPSVSAETMVLYPPSGYDWRQPIYPGDVLLFDVDLPAIIRNRTVVDFTYEFTVSKDGYSTSRLNAPFSWSMNHLDFMYSGSYTVYAYQIYEDSCSPEYYMQTDLDFINIWNRIPVKFNIYSSYPSSFAELSEFRIIVTYE